ncbi:hypothetical protein AVEN_216999-1, partial [Araneus ventricosus]
LDPMPLAPVYVGTKHAVVGYTRSIGNPMTSSRSAASPWFNLNYLYLRPVLEQYVACSGTDLVILNQGRTTRTNYQKQHPLSKLLHHNSERTLHPEQQI